VSSSALDERYGRTPGSARRRRTIGVVVAGLFAVVLVAWVVWAALDGDAATIEYRDVGHTIVDDANVSVTYQVTAPVGSNVSCAVQALNEGFSVVGLKTVALPPSETLTRTFTEQLRTTELAVSGLIYRCWLT
jgi:hypothetical protein